MVANHQEYNAKELVDASAAHWILEKDLTASGFVKETRHLLSHEDVLKSLASHAKALGKPHACEDIYQEILKTLERK